MKTALTIAEGAKLLEGRDFKDLRINCALSERTRGLYRDDCLAKDPNPKNYTRPTDDQLIAFWLKCTGGLSLVANRIVEIAEEKAEEKKGKRTLAASHTDAQSSGSATSLVPMPA